jgi:hypothetical protein
MNQNTDYNIAENTLYLESARPSCIILPRYNDNYGPIKPTIDGPAKGRAGVEYTFAFKSIDPENEDVHLIIDWGDGTDTGWIGPYSSGEQITLVHNWSYGDIFTVKAKAKDIHGDESEWSKHTINLPRNKHPINLIFERFLQHFQNLVKIMQYIFKN